MQDVVEHWDAFLRKSAFRLRARLGVDVGLRMSRAESGDTALRIKRLLDLALATSQLPGEFRIPDAAGDLSVAVLLSSQLMQCSIALNASTEGKPLTRIKWLLRQLQSAAAADDEEVPNNLLIQVNWGWGQSSQAKFEDTKDRADILLYDGNGQPIPKDAQPRSFTLLLTRKICKGKGRSTVPVLEDIQKGIEEFYSCIVERLRPYVPRAPELEGGYRLDNGKPTGIAVGKQLECVSPDVVENVVASQEESLSDSINDVRKGAELVQEPNATNDAHGP